jgi:hypothetical protein
VVNLVAILHGSEAAFERVHVALPRAGAACAAAGVRAGACQRAGRGPRRAVELPAQQGRGEAVLQAAGLDLTVLRPSVIFGAERPLPQPVRRLQALAPLMPLAGSDARFQPVWVEDVASAALVRCAGPPHSRPDLSSAPARARSTRWPSWCGWPAAGPAERPHPAAARLRSAACRPGDGAAAGRAADVARQRRLDAVPNVASGKLPGLASAGHHAHAAGGGGPGCGWPSDSADAASTAGARGAASARAHAAAARPIRGARDRGIVPLLAGARMKAHPEHRAWRHATRHRQQELLVLVHAALGADEAAGHPVRGAQAALRLRPGSAFRKEVAALQPAGKVPVLLDDGFAVWDTLAIVEYLHEQVPGPASGPPTACASAPARAACAPRCTAASARCAATAR